MPLFPDPTSGDPISMTSGQLEVPDHPILPFIEGDGTGPDIWRASQRVLDAAVEKAYGGKRKIAWYEVFAGEKSFTRFKTWLPDETVEAYRKYLVGIKGPLTTPIGKGIKPVSREGTARLVRAAITYALAEKRRSVNLVHKGNIMKFTEGAFRDWGYAVATREFRDKVVTERESWILGNKEKNPSID